MTRMIAAMMESGNRIRIVPRDEGPPRKLPRLAGVLRRGQPPEPGAIATGHADGGRPRSSARQGRPSGREMALGSIHLSTPASWCFVTKLTAVFPGERRGSSAWRDR